MDESREKGAEGRTKAATPAKAPESSAGTQQGNHLVVFRVRTEKDADFYDPAADCRFLIPGMFRATSDTLQTLSGKEAHKAIKLVCDLGKLLQVRVAEEPQTIDAVIRNYMSEYFKVPAGVRSAFAEVFMLHTIMVYAMMLRRECNNDKRYARELFTPASTGTVLSLLSEKTAKTVWKELRERHPALSTELAVPHTTDTVWLALQREDNIEVLEKDIKNFALEYLKVKRVDGLEPDWDLLSELLDKQAKACADTDPVLAEKLKNAYPGYFKDLEDSERLKGTTRWTRFWKRIRACLKL